MSAPMLSPTLASVLAVVVAGASLCWFGLGFAAPVLYRRQDLVWSGVGLFAALVLWFCSGQIRGALLLGTIAQVSLLGWLGGQAFLWRWSGLDEAQKQQGFVRSLQRWGQRLQLFFDRSLPAKPKPKSPRSPASTTPPPDPEILPELGQDSGVDVPPETPAPSNDAPNDASTDTPESLDTKLVAAEEGAPGANLGDSPGGLPDISEPAPTDPSTDPSPASGAPKPPVQTVTPTTPNPESKVTIEARKPTPTTPKSTPKALNSGDPTPSLNLFDRVRNRLQGRKSHGKRYVRPEESPQPPEPKAVPKPSPQSNPPVSPPSTSPRSQPQPPETPKPAPVSPTPPPNPAPVEQIPHGSQADSKEVWADDNWVDGDPTPDVLTPANPSQVRDGADVSLEKPVLPVQESGLPVPPDQDEADRGDTLS